MRYIERAFRHLSYPRARGGSDGGRHALMRRVVAAEVPPVVAVAGAHEGPTACVYREGALGRMPGQRAQRSPSQSATSCGNYMACTRAHETMGIGRVRLLRYAEALQRAEMRAAYVRRTHAMYSALGN